MKRLLLLAGCTLVLAACSDTSTTAPSGRAAGARARFDEDEFTCRSGYVIAFDENGNPYCIPDPNNPPGDGGGNAVGQSNGGPLGRAASRPKP